MSNSLSPGDYKVLYERECASKADLESSEEEWRLRVAEFLMDKTQAEKELEEAKEEIDALKGELDRSMEEASERGEAVRVS